MVSFVFLLLLRQRKHEVIYSFVSYVDQYLDPSFLSKLLHVNEMAKDDYNNAESILQQGMDTIGKDNLSEEFLNKLISIWEMLEDNTDLAEV